jgi:hypothetical protein
MASSSVNGNGGIEELLDRVVGRVGLIEGVAAIALGGSRARGTADEHSDVDLGIYYDSERPFSIDALDRAARDLDDRHASGLLTQFGAWGPGVNGGGWLIVDGRHVDFLYRDLRTVARAIEQCLRGQVETVYQLGHPMGFQNQIWAGETNACRPLFDPSGALSELKAKVIEYPDALRRALVPKHLFDADFELAIAEKPAARGDVSYVGGCMFRSTGFMTLVLFALNRRFYMNEKGAFELSRSFEIRPQGFHAAIARTLGHAGQSPAELKRSVARMRQAHEHLSEVAAETL